MDRVGIKGSRLDDLLRLDHSHLARCRHRRVEIARCLAEHEISARVCTPRLDDRQIRPEPGLADIELALELLHRLALGDHRADAGLGVEGRDASPARADALSQRTLRIELQFEVAIEILLFEQLVLADIRADHLPDLPGLEQHPQAEPVSPGIVGDDRQILDASRLDLGDQAFRVARQPEAARHDRHAVEQHAF